MNCELGRIPKKPGESVVLFPGIELSYSAFAPGAPSVRHEPLAHILQIDYCRTGQLARRMKDGNQIYLNPGDLSLHTMAACADSLLTFPTGVYSGLMIRIDLSVVSDRPPELLRGVDGFPGMLEKKFCRDGAFFSLTGNEQTESIFSAFYDQPEHLKLPYQKIKVLELLLYLGKIEFLQEKQPAVYHSEQVEIVRRIHDQLLENLEQRVTIEELSRQYLINTTTLKEVFKSVYGVSIAAHVKEHRMEKAAALLLQTDDSILQIAKSVGYESQSKFTTAFKEMFRVLPSEYRKRR